MFRVARYLEVDDVLLADDEIRSWYIDTLEVSLDAGRIRRAPRQGRIRSI